MPRGRPKQFDDSEVLAHAMAVFWQQGYEATSLDDLIHSMGIPRQSLYRTFTDKHTLFLESLKFYDANVINKVIETLTSDAPAIENIQGVFKIWKAGISSPKRLGCLMVNTASQDFPRDSEVTQIVKSNQRRVISALEKAIKQAQLEGDISLTIDAKSVSRTIFATINGMLLMSRTGVSRTFVKDVFATLTAMLGIALDGIKSK